MSDWLSAGGLQCKSAMWSVVIRSPASKRITHIMRSISRAPHPRVMQWNVDDMLCDVIGCYGYNVNSAAAAAQAMNNKDRSSAVAVNY